MTKHLNPHIPLADQLVAGESTIITATLWPTVAFESARNRHERTFAIKVLYTPLDVLFLGWNYVYEGYKLYGGDSSTFYPTKPLGC
jgi:hypothetical protein